MGLRNEYVSTMIYEELANGIIECVGGTENIASAINCMTRVRIRVNRDAAVSPLLPPGLAQDSAEPSLC